MRIVFCHESGSDKDDSSAHHPLGCGVYCSLDARKDFIQMHCQDVIFRSGQNLNEVGC